MKYFIVTTLITVSITKAQFTAKNPNDEINSEGRICIISRLMNNLIIFLSDFSLESQSPFLPVLSDRPSLPENLVETPRSLFGKLNVQMQQALARHRDALNQHQRLVKDAGYLTKLFYPILEVHLIS